MTAKQNAMYRPEVIEKHRLACIERNKSLEYRRKLKEGIKKRSKNKNWVESMASQRKPLQGKTVLLCDMCKKEVLKYPSHIRKNNFCSKECYNLWQQGKPNIKNSKPKIEINCLYCGKKFYVHPSREAREAKFCSRACRNKYYSGIKTGFLSGNKHWNWKGGYVGYYGPNWERQRRKALKRDNNRCQYPNCKVKENLHVHHKISFKSFGLENYKEANKLSNLITLCSSHHSLVEAPDNGFTLD